MNSSIALLISTLLLACTFAYGQEPLVDLPATARCKLQVINGSNQPIDVFLLKSDTQRVPCGSVAAGKESIIPATLGEQFAIVGRDDQREITVVSKFSVQGCRFDPPDGNGVPAFYTQSISVNGFPIVASARVNPYALKEAAYLVSMMLGKRPDVRDAMIASGSRLCIMAHDEYTTDLPEFSRLEPKNFWDARARGLGGSERDPFCSCAEENLLAYPSDPYEKECILIHEFAHNMHLRGMVNVDATFDSRLKATYDHAMATGLWKGKYASVNHHEYFAEGVQSWFDNNREDDHDHNHVNTRQELLEYDPRLAAICQEVFGDTVLKYTKPATRLDGHLSGYDPTLAPAFQWPQRLLKEKAAIRAAAEARNKSAVDNPQTRNVLGWTVHIAPELLTDQAEDTARALKLLEAQLEEIVRVVPQRIVVELKKVPLYFSVQYPGIGPSAEFHPDAGWLKNNGRDPAMAKGVEFTNIRVFEADTRRMPNFVLHELAHAYHNRVLPRGFSNPEIKAAYDKAKSSGKYDSVERRDSEGRKRLDRAYAMTSAMEYFSETTEAFFSVNDFFPYTREELKRHDPEMFALLTKLWQVAGTPDETAQGTTPTEKAKQLMEAESRLKAIYERREFSTAPFEATWSRDSTGYLRLENPNADSPELVKYDCATGKRSVLIASEQLVAPESKARLRIRQFAESPTGTKFLLRVDSDEPGSAGHWIFDSQSAELQRVKAELGGLSWAQPFSPDGRKILFHRASNIYVVDIEKGLATPLTASENVETIHNGREVWSPDSTKIAYTQTDESKVPLRSVIQPTDPSYPSVRQDRFARVGETIASLRVGVVDAAGGETQWIDLPAKPGDFYLQTVNWANNSDELLIELLSRGRDARSFLIANVRTGKTVTAYQESDRAWVDSSFGTNAGLTWVQSGAAFVLLSEQDGWRHAFHVSRDGKTKKLITAGEYDITDRGPVDESDKKNGWFTFLASPDNATQRYLYRVPLDGSVAAQRLTPENQSGTHSYNFAPNGQWAFHTYSTFDSPPVIDLVQLPEHRVIRVLEENAKVRERVKPLIVRPTEFMQVDIGEGVVMDAWMIKPRDFDASQKYPVFVFVYGEPHGQTVLDDWRGGQNHSMFHRMLADLGYLVVSLDNRGTPAPKGAAWRRAVFGSLGPLSTEEQAKGLKELARTRPYVDLSRVGIWGWSGGGSNTLNAMFRRPDLYRVGIAVAAKPQPHLYNAWFQEIYMRTRAENPDGYQQAAAINFAEGLRGDLLIIHGTGETNTHLPIIEGLVDRLIELGKPFDYMAYPNRDHGLREGKGTEVHMRMLMTKYLLEHLPPGPKRPSD